MSDFEKELIQSAQEAWAIARGEAEPAGVFVPKQINVAGLRAKLGMTQKDFAARFGFRLSALREWEQGRRSPDTSARVLLMVIDHNPDAVHEALETYAPEKMPTIPA